MAKIKLEHLVSAPRGKIVKEAQNAHKTDTVFGRDIPKSKYIVNLRSKARSSALNKMKK